MPTIWTDVLHYLRDNPGHDVSSAEMVACGGSGGSAVADDRLRQLGIRCAGLGMTETSRWPRSLCRGVLIPRRGRSTCAQTQRPGGGSARSHLLGPQPVRIDPVAVRE